MAIRQVLKLQDVKAANRLLSAAKTFRFSDLEVQLGSPEQLQPKPDVDQLEFGKFFTDHMFKVQYDNGVGGWQKPKILPMENLTLHPAAKVLHYAIERKKCICAVGKAVMKEKTNLAEPGPRQFLCGERGCKATLLLTDEKPTRMLQLFEGMKAYRGVDAKIRLFRPDLNMIRMNSSAQRSGLPTFDSNEMIKMLCRLVQIDQEWVPHSETASLYIRPTLIGIDPVLGMTAAESALLFVICSPVNSYFKEGFTAVSVLADPKYTRAWPGGVGDKKMGCNYGPTVQVQREALAQGLQQVLWLFGEDDQITEAGTMNVFIILRTDDGGRELITPPLNGLILPGVTRASILDLARQYGRVKVTERMITMKELVHYVEKGKILEMFGAGTACIVSPIASVVYKGRHLKIPTMEQEDKEFEFFLKHLSRIQYGYVDHPWGVVVDDYCKNET